MRPVRALARLTAAALVPAGAQLAARPADAMVGGYRAEDVITSTAGL